MMAGRLNCVVRAAGLLSLAILSPPVSICLESHQPLYFSSYASYINSTTPFLSIPEEFLTDNFNAWMTSKEVLLRGREKM